MNKIAAIICEFNPIHNGHKKLIDKALEGGADGIVCIMSGNYVQRGEPAILQKYKRAEAAVLCGANLCLELPMPNTVGSAEYYAEGAIDVIERLGVVDELWFGCECGDAEKIRTAAENQMKEAFTVKLEELHREGVGYAEANELAYTALYGENDIFRTPNNVLAIEYAKALLRRNSSIRLCSVKRDGDYNCDELSNDLTSPSATSIRNKLYEGDIDSIAPYMPPEAYNLLVDAYTDWEAPTDLSRLYDAMLISFRLAHPEDYDNIEGISGGLQNRIVSAALEGDSYYSFFDKLKTKKYTDARLRRSLLACLLGITHKDMKRAPEYTSLLSADDIGREILSSIRKTAKITIVTKPADTPICRQSEISDRADAVFTLCSPMRHEASYIKKMSPAVIKK